MATQSPAELNSMRNELERIGFECAAGPTHKRPGLTAAPHSRCDRSCKRPNHPSDGPADSSRATGVDQARPMKRSDFTASEYGEANLALWREFDDPSPAERQWRQRKSETLGKLQCHAAAMTLRERYGSHPFYVARPPQIRATGATWPAVKPCTGNRPDRARFRPSCGYLGSP